MEIRYSKEALERPDLLIQYEAGRNARQAVVEAVGIALKARGLVVDGYMGSAFTLTLPDASEALRFTFREYGAQQGKMGVHGRYIGDSPRSVCVSHERQPDSINCSASKSPAAIARDIERRLLPGYRANLKLVAAKVAEINVATSARDAVLAKLEAITGTKAHVAGGGRAPFEREQAVVLPLPEMDNGYGSFQIGPGGYIQIDLRSINESQAIAIAKLLCGK